MKGNYLNYKKYKILIFQNLIICYKVIIINFCELFVRIFIIIIFLGFIVSSCGLKRDLKLPSKKIEQVKLDETTR